LKFEDLKLSNRVLDLRKQTQFSKFQLPLAIRADFKCEYCNKDLLDSVDSYDSWQIDHIVPNGDGDYENLAIACKTCNFAKRHSCRDELEDCSSRDEKIALAKKMIEGRRDRKEEILDSVRKMANLIRKQGAS